MQPDVTQFDLRAAVMARLEKIVDPCSVASGVPAGLVSMGLVGPVEIEDGRAGAKVRVTLYITEPGCLMGSLFELTAGRALNELPGVAEAKVAMEYNHVWGPEQMAPSYREHLTHVRACRAAQHMRPVSRS
jgi:metal-sulfur cluster biosynthetic enzyme